MSEKPPLVARGSGRHYYYELNIGSMKFTGLVFKAEESVMSCVRVLELLSEKLGVPLSQVVASALKPKEVKK